MLRERKPWAYKENTMSGDLGNPIAFGRTSELFTWDQDHVLKLFYEWVSLESIENEAQISRAIYESGLPVPGVGELVHVNERIGLIFQRIYGDSLYRLAQHKPWNLSRYYKRGAELHVEIHSRRISSDLPSQRQILERNIRQAEALPSHLRAKVLGALEDMPDGNQLCHGDFWGGNILMTSHGEVIIDWHRASRGNPLADVARTTIGNLSVTRTKQIQRTFLSYGTSKTSQIKNFIFQIVGDMFYPFYLNQYFKLRPGGENEYRRWLPIVAAARLSHNIPELEKILITQVKRIL
jgi:uncharacterized protein (TIGR02172 family)